MEEFPSYDSQGLDGADANDTVDRDDTAAADGINWQKASVDLSPSSPISQSKLISRRHKAKWNLLSKHYSDQYLDVFTNDQYKDKSDTGLDSTQLGAVTWSGEEKDKFFSALGLHGRHALPAIAAAVGTKSPLEVKDYLMRLKEAEIDRQMFANRARNVSHAEIDAAVEIGEECEAVLEDAADALAVFQDNYDLSAATKISTGDVLIDIANASILDCKAEKETEDLETGLVDQYSKESEALSMFKLNNFLELSREVFMNMPAHSQHDHWMYLAEDDEQPSIAFDAIKDLYSLVVGFTQRIVQTAIFLALSRIRATTTPDYTPKAILKDIDVSAALNVLNLPTDKWDYWLHWAKRCQSRFVAGDHHSAISDKHHLSLRKVTDVLSIRKARGRRRSLSSMLSMSSQDEDASSNDHHADSVEDDRAEEIVERFGATEDNQTEDGTMSSSANQSEDDSTNGINDSETSDKFVSCRRKQLRLEEAHDEYMEKLDQAARLKEEAHLLELLGKPHIEAEPETEIERRPKTTRKSHQELRDWADALYRGTWERKRTAQEAFGEEEDGLDETKGFRP